MSSVNEVIGAVEHEVKQTIDFKMVTFSLAGKDYSIDIMKVKEISNANKFTFVPNSLPFVKGVYNLRGDIISIIDLRLMFNLPAPENTDKGLENLIILRLDDYQLGVIVDSIDKVVGISSSSIQPPHPIFGDINIRFIQGVVENEGRLYVILDVEKIFGQDEEFEMPSIPAGSPGASSGYAPEQSSYPRQADTVDDNLDFNFIIDTLKTFKKFVVTDVNREWVNKRFKEWVKLKGNNPGDLQLQSENDADEFLAGFYSPSTGRFWDKPLLDAFESILPDFGKNTVSVWNPGCGNGYETYSIAGVLYKKYPSASIKIWASDNDLLSISNAPNLVFKRESLPELLEPYAVESTTGLQFNQTLKDVILFEYHDVMHPNAFLEVDIIVARDLISFMSENEQRKLISEFEEKLRSGGLLVIGRNERLEKSGWRYVGNDYITGYIRD